MKLLTVLSAFLLMAILPFSANAEGTHHPDVKYYAVTFYADWCGSCKILDPAISQARESAELDKSDILFVTMDFTDKETIHQSLMLSKALGLSEYVKKAGSKTGYMVVLDANSMAELKRFDKTNDSDAIQSALKQL